MSRVQANLLLLLAAAIWGSTFVVQKLVFIGDSELELFTFTALRFALGAVVVLPFALRENARQARPLDKKTIAIFAGIGTVLFSASVLQQYGIIRTSVTNAGFLTGLYVVIVPMIAVAIYRKRPHWSVWPASAGCLAGLFLLNGGNLTSFVSGDLWVIASTVFWALHIVLVGVFVTSSTRPLTLACIQFGASAVLGGIGTVLFESPSLAVIWGFWPEILYAGAVAVGIAFTLQVVGQRHTHPADAAIILVMEMVFAALAAALILGERLSAMGIAGCVVILISVVGAEVLPLIRNQWLSRRLRDPAG
jgi:drug/metabolite transporter (DMT)-like permease